MQILGMPFLELMQSTSFIRRNKTKFIAESYLHYAVPKVIMKD